MNYAALFPTGGIWGADPNGERQVLLRAFHRMSLVEKPRVTAAEIQATFLRFFSSIPWETHGEPETRGVAHYNTRRGGSVHFSV